VTIRTGGRVITLPLSSIKTLRGPDSLTNGVVIGMLSGVGLGAFLMYYDEPRTMPASILLGGAVGAFIDALVPGRKLYYFRRTAVRVAPAVTPKSVGVHVAW
jgi:lipoprotein signal peptidase